MCEADVASTFRALGDARRRIALRCLRAYGTLSLADLAELVAERETGEDVPELSPERVSHVYFSLYHTHVPVLQETGLAWYDQEDDLVGTTDRADAALARAHDALEVLLRA